MKKICNFKLVLVLALSVLSLLSCKKSKTTTIAPNHLRCEYATSPLGIDTDAPRLSWLLPADSEVTLQGAYQILVGTDSAAISAKNSLVWDSGKIASDKQLVSYAGALLKPNTRYY